MDISLTTSADGVVITLQGRLDSITSPAAQAELATLLVDCKGPVTLACSGLEYLSSAGLRVLLLVAKNSRVDLTVTGLRDSVRDVINIAGFSLLFKIK